MWNKNAHGKEKIKHMFNNELSLDDSFLALFLYYDASIFRIEFHVDKIPNSIPEKWKNKKYDFISVKIDLCAVKTLNITGGNLGFRCTPIFSWNDEKPTVSIKSSNNNFALYCIADTMFIGEITPFHWGSD